MLGVTTIYGATVSATAPGSLPVLRNSIPVRRTDRPFRRAIFQFCDAPSSSGAEIERIRIRWTASASTKEGDERIFRTFASKVSFRIEVSASLSMSSENRALIKKKRRLQPPLTS